MSRRVTPLLEWGFAGGAHPSAPTVEEGTELEVVLLTRRPDGEKVELIVRVEGPVGTKVGNLSLRRVEETPPA